MFKNLYFFVGIFLTPLSCILLTSCATQGNLAGGTAKENTAIIVRMHFVKMKDSKFLIGDRTVPVRVLAIDGIDTSGNASTRVATGKHTLLHSCGGTFDVEAEAGNLYYLQGWSKCRVFLGTCYKGSDKPHCVKLRKRYD
jgi:hypothetical protein